MQSTDEITGVDEQNSRKTWITDDLNSPLLVKQAYSQNDNIKTLQID